MVTLPSSLSTGLTFATRQLEARGRSRAEATRVVASKVPKGVGCGERVSPSPLGNGSGEGAVPPPQKFFELLSGKWHVLVHSGYYLCTIDMWKVRPK